MSDLMMAIGKRMTSPGAGDEDDQRVKMANSIVPHHIFVNSSLLPMFKLSLSFPHFWTSNTTTKVYVMRYQGCGFIPKV